MNSVDTTASNGALDGFTFSLNPNIQAGLVTQDFATDREASSFEIKSFLYINGMCIFSFTTINNGVPARGGSLRCAPIKISNGNNSYISSTSNVGSGKKLCGFVPFTQSGINPALTFVIVNPTTASRNDFEYLLSMFAFRN